MEQQCNSHSAEQNTPENFLLQLHGVDEAQTKSHKIQSFNSKTTLQQWLEHSFAYICMKLESVFPDFPKSVSGLSTPIVGSRRSTGPAQPTQADEVILPT